MLVEGIAPIACLVLNDASLPALLLFSLHLGLLVVMNLPNWQFVGMLATTVWIPSWVWDRLHLRIVDRTITAKKKKNDDYDNQQVKFAAPRPYLTYFFLIYMLYNFCGERRWIPKHNGGDIGEFLRFSQHWVMFGRPPMTSVHTIFVGQLSDENTVDVWEYIASGRLIPMNLAARQSQIWTNMTHVYPSPRWERAIDQWGARHSVQQAEYFMTQFCQSTPFTTLTLVWQHLRYGDGTERYIKSQQDTILNVDCRDVPEHRPTK